MNTGCDSNEQRKCIETPVKTNICLVTIPLFVSLRNAFTQQGLHYLSGHHARYI